MIRKFVPEDLKEVMNLWLKGNLSAHAFVPADYWHRQYPQAEKAIADAEVYVWEAEGRLQGFLGLQKDYLAGIFVEENCRCRGIGRELLCFAKKLYPRLWLQVYEENSRAVSFYRREGFACVGKGIDQDTGEQELAMEWRR